MDAIVRTFVKLLSNASPEDWSQEGSLSKRGSAAQLPVGTCATDLGWQDAKHHR